MRYVILNLPQVNGYLQGHIQQIHFLYYEGPRDHSMPYDGQSWGVYLNTARFFATEREAWDHAYDIWGMNFAQSNFAVVSVQEPAIRDAAFIEDRIKINQQ